MVIPRRLPALTLGFSTEAGSCQACIGFGREIGDLLLHEPKVVAATLGAAVTSFIVWMLSEFVGIDIPLSVSGALTTIFVFLLGYLTSDQIEDPAGAGPWCASERGAFLTGREGLPPASCRLAPPTHQLWGRAGS